MVISDKQIHDILTRYPGGGPNATADAVDTANVANKLSGVSLDQTQGKTAQNTRADSFTLSERAKEVALALSSTVKATGGETSDRIRTLTKAVGDGSYQPKGLAIAGKMLGRAVADKLSK